jgi:hypothetical protein
MVAATRGLFMKTRLSAAALAAAAVLWLAPQAQAGCVISPDRKSITVVTDNGANEEKNCAVKCKVDTKIGVVQVSCGGNTPPLAKAHSLCAFEKPASYYKKVISSEDSCKGGAPAEAAPEKDDRAAAQKRSFTCRIAADGKSAEAVIVNPYKQEASCQANCQISTTRTGITFQFSCSKTAAAGPGEVVLCRQTFDKGKLVKMVGGSGDCTNPQVPARDAEKDADDDDEKLADEMQKRALDMLKSLRKP